MTDLPPESARIRSDRGATDAQTGAHPASLGRRVRPRSRPNVSADACIFCGSPDISEEHIYPRKWIAKVFELPKDEALGHRHLRMTDTLVDFDTWWGHREADLVVRCACRACNSGWMNRLDDRAQFVVGSMVRGEQTILPAMGEQLLLARWITKLAFMFDYQQQDPALPSDMAERFYRTQIPPETAYIWLAASPPVGGRHHASGHTWSTAGRSDSDWYLLTTRVDHLVMQFIVPISEGGRLQPRRARYENAVCQVWPPTYLRLAWPPTEVLDELEYVGFALTFILATAHHDKIVEQFRDEVMAAGRGSD